jgi:hypothetical protein
MGAILLGTVAVKFLIEGPGLIDTTRRGATQETAVYFIFTEIGFLTFALALFITGVACLRKRTNAYLLRQFNQHLLHTSRNESRSTPLNSDDLFLDTPGDEESGGSLTHANDESPFTNLHHHPEGLSPITTPVHNCVFHSALITSGSGRRGHRLLSDGRPPRRCPHFHNSAAAAQLLKQQPPPYNVALYLPLPNHDQDQDQDTTTFFAESRTRISSDPTMSQAEKEKLECELIAVAISESTGDRARDPETPPPSYEEFTFQI